jgi:hypothetical protein
VERDRNGDVELGIQMTRADMCHPVPLDEASAPSLAVFVRRWFLFRVESGGAPDYSTKGRSTMAAVTPKYRGTGEYFLVFDELVKCARHRGTVTYQEIAELIGFPVVGAHMGREVGHLVGEISEDQHGMGRPMLSAIVVGVDGLPGEGFFKLATSLGKFSGHGDEEQRRFWEQERSAVYELWRKKFS